METKIKKLKCELCGTEHFLLIQIEVATETWGGRAGICCSCFKNGDIGEKVFLKQKKFIEEQIEHANERKNYWENELKNL